MLGGEISNIYKRGDRTRKVHNVVFAPSFDAVERLQARLEKIGNIRSDGRPILGLDSRDLLEIVLDTDPACHLIPAHIWTPWFSLLGSKSGFDSVAECFADLTPHIFALETGLSSDPPMNWRVSGLDRYTLVSNSDAHSPEKLGREATLFDCELAYGALFEALKYAGRLPSPAHGSGGRASLAWGEGYLGTIEFFPEEGKYHFDGHRACGIVWDPPTTRAHNEICPVCGKPVTVGVMHRVEALADRPEGFRPAGPRPFYSLIPLPELLGEVYGVGASSKQVQAEYFKLLAASGRRSWPSCAKRRWTTSPWSAASAWRKGSAACAAARWSPSPATTASSALSGCSAPRACPRRRWGCLGRRTKDERRRTKNRGQGSGIRSQGAGVGIRSWRAGRRGSRRAGGRHSHCS